MCGTAAAEPRAEPWPEGLPLPGLHWPRLAQPHPCGQNPCPCSASCSPRHRASLASVATNLPSAGGGVGSPVSPLCPAPLPSTISVLCKTFLLAAETCTCRGQTRASRRAWQKKIAAFNRGESQSINREQENNCMAGVPSSTLSLHTGFLVCKYRDGVNPRRR